VASRQSSVFLSIYDVSIYLSIYCCIHICIYLHTHKHTKNPPSHTLTTRAHTRNILYCGLTSIMFECQNITAIHCNTLQGGEDPQDTLSCRSFFAKEPLYYIGLTSIIFQFKNVTATHCNTLLSSFCSRCLFQDVSISICVYFNISLQYTATHY